MPSIYMHVRPAEAWTIGWILFIFDILSITGRFPVNMNTLASKAGTLQSDPKTRNGNFPEKNTNDFE
jgi:hypothetical protein